MTPFRPQNLREALTLLEHYRDALPTAGKTRTLSRHTHPLVDLENLGLRYIHTLSDPSNPSQKGFVIGATTTMEDLLYHPEITQFLGGFLQEGIQRTLDLGLATPSSSVGGEVALARGKSPLLAAFLALEGWGRICSRHGANLVLLDVLYSPAKTHVIAEHEILEEILFPPIPPNIQTFFCWKNNHLGAAVAYKYTSRLESNKELELLRIVPIGFLPRPQELDGLQAFLLNNPLTQETLEFALTLGAKDFAGNTQTFSAFSELLQQIFTKLQSPSP